MATALVVISFLVVGWVLMRGEEQSSLGHLRWRTPAGWSVTAADTGGCDIAPGVTVGPFIGTVATRSMYRRTSYGWECARDLAIPRKPADGVVSWVDTLSFPTGQRVPGDGGPGATGVCGGGAGGRIFHSFRVLTGPAEHLVVTLDGCAFGPKAGTYVEQLSALSASFRYV